MRKKITFLFIILIAVVACDQNKQVYQWEFEEQDGAYTVESSTGKIYALNNRYHKPEFVEGLKNEGLRLNGYSTWLNDRLPSLVHVPVNISGWLALEAYPLDSSGFLSLTDPSLKTGVSVGVNKFGFPFICYGSKYDLKYSFAKKAVDKFEWLHFSFNLDQEGEAGLYINGKIVLRDTLNDFTKKFSKFSHFAFGRHFIKKKRWGFFEVSAVNGLMDNISLRSETLSAKKINKEYIKNLPRETPGLTIPEERFEDDFNRPAFHMVPAANWTNEPHGLIYYKGLYHIFNQKNPNGLLLFNMNWGHYSSPDLITWTEHRPILWPEPGYDQFGCWSGHAVIDDSGQPAIMYTSGDGENFGMAMANPKDDSLLNWEKHAENPLVPHAPKHFARKDMRDPYIWKEQDTWYMIVGFGLKEEGVRKGTVLLYKSDDLVNWEYLHPLFTGDPQHDNSGVFWEMPVFRKMNGTRVLLVNKVPHEGEPAVSLYWTGRFENEKFKPDFKHPKRLEIVNRFLSPSVNEDTNGRTIAVGIIPDEIYPEAQLRQGWTHLFSIPRVWSLENKTIHQKPLPELKRLREEEMEYPNIRIKPGESGYVNISDHQLEMQGTFKPENCSQLGWIIGQNPDKSERTKIYYDYQRQQFVVDRSQSSINPFFQGRDEIRTGDFSLGNNESFDFQIYIDGSVVEFFINNRAAFTTRIFPMHPESNGVDLFVEKGSATVENLKFWRLKGSHNKVSW